MNRPPVATSAGWRAIAACAAFAVGIAVGAAGWGSSALVAAALLLAAATCVARSAMRGRRVLLPVLLGAACACGVARGAQAQHSNPAWLATVGHGPAVLSGTVREGTGARRSATQVVIDVDRLVHSDGDIAVHAAVLATARGGPRVLPGDRVRLDVKGLRPPGTDTPGTILAREGIDAVAQSPTLTVQAEGGPSPSRWLEVARARLGGAVESALPEPAAALVEAVDFGIRRPLSADLTAALQDAGLAHVLAISGLKVVLVAGMLAALCTALALSPRVRLLLTASGVGAYVVLCGATPAAVRSALMAGAGWGLRGTGRVPDPLPLLAATGAAMLLVDPGLCRDTGFQLSFLGTLGIVLLAAPLARRLPGPRLLREPFATTLAAQLVTLPVMASTFGVVSLVGPMANALAVPLLPPLIVAGVLGSVLALLMPALATAALAPAGGIALVIAAIAGQAAALPFVAFHVSAWPRVYLVAELVALAVAAMTWRVLRVAQGRAQRTSVIGPPRESGGTALTPAFAAPAGAAWDAHRRGFAALRLSRRTAVVLACSAALLTGVVVVIAGTRADGRLHVAILDAGGARAVAIRTATGDNALVDTGSDAQRLLQVLGPALPPLTRSLGLVVLTGGDRGAAGGLAGLADRYGIARIVVPASGLGSALRTTLSTLGDRGSDVVTAPPDTAWTWGGDTWRLLTPDGSGDEGTALQITDPSGSALLLGNLTATAQEELAALRGHDLAADLLVTPPAGAVAPALIDAVRPRLIAVPDARSGRGSTAPLLSGPSVRHVAQGGTLTYTGSDGGLLAT